MGFLTDICLMAARMDKFNLAESKAIHNYSRKNFHQISYTVKKGKGFALCPRNLAIPVLKFIFRTVEK